MRVMHVITGLDDGGAEAVLYRLCSTDREHRHHVVSMMGAGKYGPLLQAAGVEVSCLGMAQGRLSACSRSSGAYAIRPWRPAARGAAPSPSPASTAVCRTACRRRSCAARLEALLRHFNLGHAVELPGFVKNQFAIMRAAGVFVLSSAWEGLPTVLARPWPLTSP